VTPQPRCRATSILIRARYDDTGASLILALIFITVVALVLGSILAFSGTSVRTTVALRTQATTQYSADGAAKIAINQLRKGTGSISSCVQGNGHLQLPNFHAGQTGSPAVSSYVSCERDAAASEDGFLDNPDTGPGVALLTLGTGSDGLTITSNASSNNAPNEIDVDGGIFSNTSITSSGVPVKNTWTPPADHPDAKSFITARSGCSATVQPQPPGSSTVDTDCTIGSAYDPNGVDPGTLVGPGTSYDKPGAQPAGTVGDCNKAKKYRVLTPGTYTDITKLEDLRCANGNGQASYVYFSPGVYIFNFTGNDKVWDVPSSSYLIAGTLVTGLDPGETPSDMTNACVGPDSSTARPRTSTDPGTGVEFVFLGDSGMKVDAKGNDGANVAICAAPSTSGPPIAIYAPRAGDADAGNTSVLTTADCPKCDMSVAGAVYAPARSLDVTFNNRSTKSFASAIIARSVKVTVSASAKFNGTPLRLAGGLDHGYGSPTPVNFMVLDVYTCSTTSCDDHTGRLALRSRIQVNGWVNRTTDILSWAEQR
jgi:hypothetical protein